MQLIDRESNIEIKKFGGEIKLNNNTNKNWNDNENQNEKQVAHLNILYPFKNLSLKFTKGLKVSLDVNKIENQHVAII